MPLEREEVERILAPHACIFIDMYRMAIAEMKAISIFPFNRKAVQAAVLSELVDRYINIAMMESDAPLEQLHVVRRHGSPRVIVSGEIFIRFKKASGRKRVGQNIMTKAEVRFLNPMLPDAEFPELTKIEIVYTLDSQTRDLIRLEALSRNGEDAVWRIDLLEMMGETMPLPLTLPLFEDPPAERRARVVLKKGNAKDHGAQSK
jgi:hypothetical protein